ncbi:uncharacterized protein TNCV_1232121 [Trichonephila clavipes]|nr:uncharacterized protein TNCV_1232121 [Trichonephila clavipes]
MPCMDWKTFSKCLENLCNKNENGKAEMLQISRDHVRQAILYLHPDLVQNNMIDITVSCDGTWHKRGHTSLDDVAIEKEECVNHVAKRLGTALRSKIKERRFKGVTLGGRKQGSLTFLQNFYRKAIVDNVPEVDNLKTSILATLFHCMSTDAKPMHNKCPEGKLSWCFYNRAKTDNKVPGSHKSMKTKLSEEVVAKIMPVYQRLASR